MAAYDSVWITGLAMEMTQSTDVALLRDAIPVVAQKHVGALGSIRLNDAGDLAHANYDIWTITDGQWAMSGSYYPLNSEFVFSDATAGSPADDRITIGGILPITGDASISGEQLDVAVEYAEARFNEYLQENGIDWDPACGDI